MMSILKQVTGMAALTAAAAILLTACGSAANTARTSTSTTAPIVQAAATTTTEEATTTEDATTTIDYVPTAADFTVAITILSKECFGSAGCDLTYRVQPTYGGPVPLDPSTQYTVTYNVGGGQEGDQVESFTIQGTSASVDEQESIQTASSKTKLTTTVTNVLVG
jgi:hypothetical protein